MSLNTVTNEELAHARQCRAEAWAVTVGIPKWTVERFEEFWGVTVAFALEAMLDKLAVRIAGGCGKCHECVVEKQVPA